MAGLKSKAWKILGMLVSVTLLGIAFWMADLERLAGIFKKADIALVGAVVVLNYGVIIIKAFRWRMVLATTKPVGHVTMFLITLVGLMANTFLPARGGLAVRLFVLRGKEGISKTTIAGTITLDHVLEGLSMVMVLALLPFVMTTPDWLRKGTLIMLAVMAGLFVVGIIIVRTRHTAWIEWLPLPKAWHERLIGALSKLRQGFSVLNRPFMTLGMIAVSLLNWALQAFMVYLCMRALGMQLGFVQSLFVLMVINMAIVLPAGPSSIGTFEFAAIMALTYLGFDRTAALSFALLYHFVQLIPTTLTGIVLLPTLGMKFGDLRMGKQVSNEDPAPL